MAHKAICNRTSTTAGILPFIPSPSKRTDASSNDCMGCKGIATTASSVIRTLRLWATTHTDVVKLCHGRGRLVELLGTASRQPLVPGVLLAGRMAVPHPTLVVVYFAFLVI